MYWFTSLPTDQNYWPRPAIDRLQSEHDQTAQKSLLLLLWYAQTDAADRVIETFANDANRPSAARDYARELLHRKDDIPLEERARATVSTEAGIRQKRRERMKAVSDEALIDLDDYSAMLMASASRAEPDFDTHYPRTYHILLSCATIALPGQHRRPIF
jgi:hypothetical protein